MYIVLKVNTNWLIKKNNTPLPHLSSSNFCFLEAAASNNLTVSSAVCFHISKL